jgi:hypothetical protein
VADRANDRHTRPLQRSGQHSDEATRRGLHYAGSAQSEPEVVTGRQAARIVWAEYWDDLPVTRNRSKQETLALPINALALLILRDYQETGGWNSRNWMLESKQYGTARDQEIMDAWLRDGRG